jgi:secondary thiamine-phosphate synthase enzyme
MQVFQYQFKLPAQKRGFHLVTEKVIAELKDLSKINAGMLQVFIQHTSASLTINENADPTVRMDFESHFNKMVPENAPYYQHTYEGPDDMPAHIKASLLGPSIQIPVQAGRLMLGTWQGIYLCEHRDYGSARKLFCTLWGI